MNDMILVNNSTSSTVAANGVIPLGSAVHGYGCGIKLNGNSLVLREKGYYQIIANITADVTAATAITASMNVDGTTTAAAAAVPAAAGETVNLTLVWIARKSCCCDSSVVSFALDSAATVTNIVVEVIKI